MLLTTFKLTVASWLNLAFRLCIYKLDAKVAKMLKCSFWAICGPWADFFVAPNCELRMVQWLMQINFNLCKIITDIIFLVKHKIFSSFYN